MSKTILISLLSIFLCNCQSNNFDQRNSISITQSKNTLTNISLNKAIQNVNQETPWDELQKQVRITNKDNQRIKSARQTYLSSQYHFENILINSEPYIYYIMDELKKRDMPVELAILPLIESNYTLKSKSSSNAAGLWQIVPITAKGLNLEKTNWYDGRYDLAASTNAALDLLQYLNKQFDGDWLLTLAAYNAGEGRVKRAINQNKKQGLPTDYWSLSLSKETTQYIPKVLAVLDIIRNNQKYNIKLPNLSPENQLVKVKINRPISLEKLAKYTELDDKIFLNHNLAYTQKQLKSPNYVFIPKSYSTEFKYELAKHNLLEKPANLNNHSTPQMTALKSSEQQNTMPNMDSKSENKYAKTIQYEVKAGDNLGSIAEKHNIKISDLVEWNGLNEKNKVREGDNLLIYPNPS